MASARTPIMTVSDAYGAPTPGGKQGKKATAVDGPTPKRAKILAKAKDTPAKRKRGVVDLTTPAAVKKAAAAEAANAEDAAETEVEARKAREDFNAYFQYSDPSSFKPFKCEAGPDHTLAVIPTSERIEVALDFNGRKVFVGLKQTHVGDEGAYREYVGVVSRPDKGPPTGITLSVSVENNFQSDAHLTLSEIGTDEATGAPKLTLVSTKLAAQLNVLDCAFWELNKFHFNNTKEMKGTGRGVVMLAVISAWCLLARPDAPPMRVLRTSGAAARAFYRAMGFYLTEDGNKDLELPTSGCKINSGSIKGRHFSKASKVNECEITEEGVSVKVPTEFEAEGDMDPGTSTETAQVAEVAMARSEDLGRPATVETNESSQAPEGDAHEQTEAEVDEIAEEAATLVFGSSELPAEQLRQLTELFDHGHLSSRDFEAATKKAIGP